MYLKQKQYRYHKQFIVLMPGNELYLGYECSGRRMPVYGPMCAAARAGYGANDLEVSMEENTASIYPGDEPYHPIGPFARGMRDAIPIGLGYCAVSFSLGIAAGNVGYTTFQGFLLSLLNVSSSGEYAGIVLSAEQAGFIELALMIFVANARYLLMSFALSQRFAPDATLFHRLTIGFGVTDELFGLGIASKGCTQGGCGCIP